MIRTHKRLSATVAGVTALAASIMLYVLLFSSSGAAYALEQTDQANSRVTSYHVKVTPAPIDHMGETWVQLNPDGTLLRARLEIFSADDGPKASIVSRDKAEVWFKMKHSHVILGDKTKIERTFKQVEAARAYYDPKLAFEQLMAEKKAGKVQVDTREPTRENEPVTLTVTSKAKPDQQQLYEVNPQTKLVERVFEMERKDGRWKLAQLRKVPRLQQGVRPQCVSAGDAQRLRYVRLDQHQGRAGERSTDRRRDRDQGGQGVVRSLDRRRLPEGEPTLRRDARGTAQKGPGKRQGPPYCGDWQAQA